MGGSDPGNETSKVLEGLQAGWQSEWTVDVVVVQQPIREFRRRRMRTLAKCHSACPD